VTRDRARESLRARWRAGGWYDGRTVGDALTDGARAHPDSQLVFTAAGGESNVTTLAELHRAGMGLAAALHGVGVVPGDVVAVQGPADRPTTEVLEALWLLGAVVVPLGATHGLDEMAHILREAGARTIVAPAEFRGVPLAAQAVEHRDDWGLDRVLVLGDDGPPGAVPTRSLLTRSLPSELPERPGSPAASSADVCCILYTSGSTAMPKGVQHSHESLLAGLTAVPADATTRTLAPFPAGHVASLLGLLRPLSVGGTTVVMDRWSARSAAALVEEHRLTNSAGTPFFLATLLDEADRTGRDISSLTRYLCGAASVPPSLVARADARGIVTWRTYGSTEHPAITSGVPDDPFDKRCFTDGRPGPGNEIRLVDEHDAEVPHGDEGEIVARGPKQFVGYRDPALDGDAFLESPHFEGVWFRTGDLGRLDPDGYLVVTDRLKDIIIRGGENISAREVEDALAAHPAVDDVAVCAAPDPVWGEQVCAFVVAAPDSPPTLHDLTGYLRAAGVAAHKAPTQLFVVDQLPRTAAGKVRKQELREQLRREQERTEPLRPASGSRPPGP
jgi:cyclohexanecarboxylate-CoA ligase